MTSETESQQLPVFLLRSIRRDFCRPILVSGIVFLVEYVTFRLIKLQDHITLGVALTQTYSRESVTSSILSSRDLKNMCEYGGLKKSGAVQRRRHYKIFFKFTRVGRQTQLIAFRQEPTPISAVLQLHIHERKHVNESIA